MSDPTPTNPPGTITIKLTTSINTAIREGFLKRFGEVKTQKIFETAAFTCADIPEEELESKGVKEFKKGLIERLGEDGIEFTKDEKRLQEIWDLLLMYLGTHPQGEHMVVKRKVSEN